jgi:hypothetical protein
LRPSIRCPHTRRRTGPSFNPSHHRARRRPAGPRRHWPASRTR